MSARPDLGWRVLMRAQDMMAPPFSIGLCGLSGEDTIININNQIIYQILFLSKQISLKFFPLGSYPANKNLIL